MAKIREAGWYAETTEDEHDGYEFVSIDLDGLVDYLDDEGDLVDIITEWAVSYYDFEDFIREIVFNDNLYADREGIIEDWKSIGMDGETSVDRWGGDILYFDAGEDVEADFIIDSDGEKECFTEDEDEDEDEDEEDD